MIIFLKSNMLSVLVHLMLFSTWYFSSSNELISIGDSSRHLKKPYTLKIPVLLPIGGPIAPLGKMCTEPIELFLSIVNNRSDILPEYNIVYDIIDDQCRDKVAVENIMPFFIDGKRIVNVSESRNNIGQYCLPANKTFVKETAETGYIPPFLIGGMCSGVCKAVGRYVQLFDVINFSAACNAGTMSDRKLYRNLYRLMSEMQIADSFVSLSRVMKWNKVAMISDLATASFMVTKQTLALFPKWNIDVAVVEFYMDNPYEAVATVKKSGIRVIIVNCYYDTCPFLACQAYNQGLYGTKIIWFFPGGTDFVNTNVQTICTKDMLRKIDLGAFYLRQTAPDYKTTPIEIGLTGQDLDTFLESVVPNLWKDRFVDSRWMCFDSVAPSVHILDNVERRLNAKGMSLRHYIAQPSKTAELSEMIRNATISIDVRIFSGRIRYEPGEQEVLVPNGFEQSQFNNERKLVIFDKAVDATDDTSRFLYKEPIIWFTKDGNMPKMEVSVVVENKQVPLWVGGIFSAISLTMVLIASGILGLQIYFRNHSDIANTYPIMSNVALIGMTILLGTIVVFPGGTVRTFCRAAPLMVTIGYSLLNGALVLKLSYKYPILIPSKSAQRNTNKTPENAAKKPSNVSGVTIRAIQSSTFTTFRSNTFLQQYVTSVGLVIWLLVNGIFCVIWYVVGGMPTTATTKFVSLDEEADIEKVAVWEICASEEDGLYVTIFAGIIVALQGVSLLSAMFLAVMKRQKVAKELKYTVKAVYILFPAAIAEVLTVAIAKTPDVIYCFLSIVVMLKCLAVMYLFFGTKIKLYRNLIKNHLYSDQQRSNTVASTLPPTKLAIPSSSAQQMVISN